MGPKLFEQNSQISLRDYYNLGHPPLMASAKSTAYIAPASDYTPTRPAFNFGWVAVNWSRRMTATVGRCDHRGRRSVSVIKGFPASGSHHHKVRAARQQDRLRCYIVAAYACFRMTLIYLIAGEASGDVLGSRLMQVIAARRPEIAICWRRRCADDGAWAGQPVPDAGTRADGPAGGAAATPAVAPAATSDGSRHYRATTRRCRNDRQPGLHPARAACNRYSRP